MESGPNDFAHERNVTARCELITAYAPSMHRKRQRQSKKLEVVLIF